MPSTISNPSVVRKSRLGDSTEEKKAGAAPTLHPLQKQSLFSHHSMRHIRTLHTPAADPSTGGKLKDFVTPANFRDNLNKFMGGDTGDAASKRAVQKNISFNDKLKLFHQVEQGQAQGTEKRLYEKDTKELANARAVTRHLRVFNTHT